MKKLSVRETEKLIKELKNPKKEKEKKKSLKMILIYKDLEEKMKTVNGNEGSCKSQKKGKRKN